MLEKNRDASLYFRKSMKLLGYNQTEMASILGITRSHTCNIMKGRRGVSGRLMLKIEKLKKLKTGE